jgi:hypothetical protein
MKTPKKFAYNYCFDKQILCRIHAPDSTWCKVTVSSLELERPAKFRNFRIQRALGANDWSTYASAHLLLGIFGSG